MKMADLKGRIVRPLGKPEPHEATSFRSPLYAKANELGVGETMIAPLSRDGLVTRLRKAMPGKVFKQFKNGDHYLIRRMPDPVPGGGKPDVSVFKDIE